MTTPAERTGAADLREAADVKKRRGLRLAMLWAQGLNGVIGRGSELPWPKLPEDLREFKNTTMGGTLVMGRKTYESIGRPLPGRTTLVLSRDTTLSLPEGVRRAASPAECLELADLQRGVFVVGGAQIYAQFLGLADHLYVTLVKDIFAGDVFYDGLGQLRAEDWQTVERRPLSEIVELYQFLRIANP